MSYFTIKFFHTIIFQGFLKPVFLVLFIFCVNSIFAKGYYICSLTGLDSNNGTSSEFPWKTTHKIKDISLFGGDTIYFSCGSEFTGGFEIADSGLPQQPIVLTSYGKGGPPKFSNPTRTILDGNAIRVSGNHIVVQNFYFHDCAAAVDNDSTYTKIWDVGAVRIMHGADYCVVRDCEFYNCPKGIQSTGEHILIKNNYLHSANKRALSFPGWGPIAIQIGNSNHEISYNTIKDYYYIGGEFGADGGAIEIDDGRNLKKNIFIHHNFSSSNMGFLEVSWFADIAKTETYNLRLSYNVSDDYQQFAMLWAPTHDAYIENNTIFRRKQIKNAIVPAVFLCDYEGVTIRNNIIITDSVTQVYTGTNKHYHTNNLYWSIDETLPNVGATLHPSELYNINPQLDTRNGENGHYPLKHNSPAIDTGADLKGRYIEDFLGQTVPSGKGVDIGAFEYISNTKNNN